MNYKSFIININYFWLQILNILRVYSYTKPNEMLEKAILI